MSKVWRRGFLAVLAVVCWDWAAIGGAPESAKVSKGDYTPLKATSEHFEVESTLGSDVGRSYAALSEKAYAKFCKIFDVKKDEKVWDGKCKIYLFANREEFVKFGKEVDKSPIATASGGYTCPKKENPYIVLYLEKRDYTDLQRALIHEMTHVFLQLFHKETFLPAWLQEGFAQYFEFSHFAGGSNEKTMRSLVKSMVQAGLTIPLKDFLVKDFPGTDAASYAQSWSMIDFITGNKELCRKTGRLVLKLKDAIPEQKAEIVAEGGEFKVAAPDLNLLEIQEKALKDVFGVSVPRLEAMWKRYVMTAY